MDTETTFEEINSLISVVEAMQRDLSIRAFDTLKNVEGELPYFHLGRIQKWVENKSVVFFQFARTINRKAEKISENNFEFIRPVSRGSYMPVGIDIDGI